MQPICLLLPAGTASSRALLRVFQLGHCRISRARRADSSFPARRKRHLEGMATLLHRQLLHAEPPTTSIWMDRRELGELLFLLDQGLCALREDGVWSENTSACIEAAQHFLNSMRQFARKPPNTARKPRRQELALAAAGD